LYRREESFAMGEKKSRSNSIREEARSVLGLKTKARKKGRGSRPEKREDTVSVIRKTRIRGKKRKHQEDRMISKSGIGRSAEKKIRQQLGVTEKTPEKASRTKKSIRE